MNNKPLLITSIAPPILNGMIDEEKMNWTKLCISSWKKSGHDVISINVQFEIDKLISIYPEIDFLETKKSTMPLNGRPLIFIYDALRLGREKNHKRYAICNADVLIGSDISGINFPPNTCAYSSRIDIESPESTQGNLFFGIDYFNCSQEHFDAMIPAYFAFGLPWWDYWLPIQAIFLNMNLKRLINQEGGPILLHKKHVEAWSPNDLCNMGQHFLEMTHFRKDRHGDELSFIESYKRNPSIISESAQIYASIARNMCSYIHSKASEFII
jgi:hypothetical protein